MPDPVAPADLVCTVVAGPQVNLAWTADGIDDETGFSIQRRDINTREDWTEIDTVAADVVAYEGDVGPFDQTHRYQYRVVVAGGASDGLATNVDGVFGVIFGSSLSL